jgi:hypothetical protein
MENNQQNISETFPTIQKKQISKGSIIGGILTVIILASLAFYILSISSTPANEVAKTSEVIETKTVDTQAAVVESSAEADPTIDALSTQSDSDDVSAIEADTNATDLNAVMADIDKI